MAGADRFAIMKAMGHADNKTTMIYVSLGKSCIREQVEKLNGIGRYRRRPNPLKHCQPQHTLIKRGEKIQRPCPRELCPERAAPERCWRTCARA
jgi:hydrogenase maturation factor HypF (carbamoyltransferase family)